MQSEKRPRTGQRFYGLLAIELENGEVYIPNLYNILNVRVRGITPGESGEAVAAIKYVDGSEETLHGADVRTFLTTLSAVAAAV
jgi:hypothetical protein